MIHHTLAHVSQRSLRWIAPGPALLIAVLTVGYSMRAETVGADSTVATKGVDSLSMGPDSLRRMTTPINVGSLDRSLDSSQIVTGEDIHWHEYQYLGDLLETRPGIYILNQQGAGQYNQLSVRGSDWRSIDVMVGGRSMADPSSGIYNLFYANTEYVDHIEVITGPRAFLYGLNSTGGAVNIITKNFNINTPFTKLNYEQAAYNYEYSDGTFSQNLTRSLNLMVGFQHQGTDGRFPNSADIQWNFRAKLRYNISSTFDVILSEYYTSTNTDMNGGVNLGLTGTAAAFNRDLAFMKNTNSYEKVNRHDVDLTLVGSLLGDSTNVSTLTFSYSTLLRQYRDEENRDVLNGVFIQSDHDVSWYGLTSMQNFDTRWQRLSFGVSGELREIHASPNLGARSNAISSAWGKEEILFTEGIKAAGFARYDHYLGSGYVGIGGDATVSLSPAISAFGGISISRRVPTYQELYWSDSTVSRSGPIEAEKHRQAEAGLDIRWPGTGTIRLAYFHRTVENPITISPIEKSYVFPGIHFANGERIATNGIEAKANLQIWHISLEGVATYLSQGRSDGSTLEDYPKLSARGSVSFRGRILHDRLELRTGFQGRYSSSQRGSAFNPEVVAYVPSPGPVLGKWSAVDFFLIAHIGDAYVHFTWENLTNVEYFSIPFAPGPDRAIRLGILWEFTN